MLKSLFQSNNSTEDGSFLSQNFRSSQTAMNRCILELRVRCIIEQTTNSDFYLADGYGERLLRCLKNPSSVLDPEVLRSSSFPGFVKKRNTSKLGRYASSWELFLKRTIKAFTSGQYSRGYLRIVIIYIF